MVLVTWAQKRIKKMNIWDFGFFKLSLLILGMILGAYLSNFVLTNVWIFIALFAVFYLIVLIRIFR